MGLKPRSHDTGMEFCRQKIITVSTVHTIPADYIPRFDNMLHKSVKIDRIKYPTTTFAVLLISFCITVMKFLRLGVHTAL
jgi:hypothetical protein